MAGARPPVALRGKPWAVHLVIPLETPFRHRAHTGRRRWPGGPGDPTPVPRWPFSWVARQGSTAAVCADPAVRQASLFGTRPGCASTRSGRERPEARRVGGPSPLGFPRAASGSRPVRLDHKPAHRFQPRGPRPRIRECQSAHAVSSHARGRTEFRTAAHPYQSKVSVTRGLSLGTPFRCILLRHHRQDVALA